MFLNILRDSLFILRAGIVYLELVLCVWAELFVLSRCLEHVCSSLEHFDSCLKHICLS